MDPNYTQNIRLSEKIPNLYSSLSVVIGSGNSNFDSGFVIYYSKIIFLILGV